MARGVIPEGKNRYVVRASSAFLRRSSAYYEPN
jgi:hypothetical protein